MIIHTNSPIIAQPAAAAAAKVGGDAQGFGPMMVSRMKQLAGQGMAKKDEASKAAQQFVSTALIMPMLKQLRSSTFKSEYFHGGHGEDAFGPQLDQILADRIVQRMSTPEQDSAAGPATRGLGLVDAVYRQIIRQADGPAQADKARAARKVDLHG